MAHLDKIHLSINDNESLFNFMLESLNLDLVRTKNLSPNYRKLVFRLYLDASRTDLTRGAVTFTFASQGGQNAPWDNFRQHFRGQLSAWPGQLFFCLAHFRPGGKNGEICCPENLSRQLLHPPWKFPQGISPICLRHHLRQ